MTRLHNILADAAMLAVALVRALFGRGGSTFPQDDEDRYLSRKDRNDG